MATAKRRGPGAPTRRKGSAADHPGPAQRRRLIGLIEQWLPAPACLHRLRLGNKIDVLVLARQRTVEPLQPDSDAAAAVLLIMDDRHRAMHRDLVTFGKLLRRLPRLAGHC